MEADVARHQPRASGDVHMMSFIRRLGSFFTRRHLESRLSEEMSFHIDAAVAKNMAAGMNEADARQTAMKAFGSVEYSRDVARDSFRFTWFEDAWRDVVIGARGLRRNPGFAAATFATLALGMGAATAMFSVVNGVFLRSLPYPDADRIVRLYQLDTDGNRSSASAPNYDDWKAKTRSFASMATMQVMGNVPVSGSFEPHLARIVSVSREFFEVMQVKPVIGRAFHPVEQAQGAPPVAIVSWAYWQRVLGGGTTIGSHVLRSGASAYTVVGVMPAGFTYPSASDIWVPAELERPTTSRTAHNYAVIARVAGGVEMEHASRELSAVSRALKAQYGEATWMTDAAVVPLREQLTASAKPALAVLFGAAIFLLVIACTNVSNLLIARAASRDRELAVRLTMGAGRWRVVRQLLAETMLMCVVGGGCGVLLAIGGVKLLLWMQPSNLPRLGEISVSWPVMGFAMAISTMSAVVLGLVTALRIPDARISSTLSGSSRSSAGGRASRRVRETLVVAQVAMTLVLLSGAGLLVRSFVRVLSVDVGYRTDDALVLDVTVPGNGEPWRHRLVAYHRDLVARLSALPGVTRVGLINDFPLGGGWYSNGEFVEMTTPTEIQSYEDRQRVLSIARDRKGNAGFRVANAGYFDAMGIPLLSGRLFATSDKASDDVHVAVVSKSLVNTKWPNQDPIGRLIQFGNMDGDMHALRIIGVVGDVREFGPEAKPGPLLYALTEQRPVGASRFSVIVRGPPSASMTAAAQRVARELAPDVPVTVRSAVDAFDRSLSGRRFNLVVIGTFAGVALTLAMLGLYGLIAYLSHQRRREFGIRVALGARGMEITRLVVGKSLVLSLTGIVLGVAASLALTRLMQNLLFGVTATDPTVFSAVVLLLLLAVGLASYLPAWRAMRMAPMTALRVD